MKSKNLNKEGFLILKFPGIGALNISKPQLYFFCFGLLLGAVIGVIAVYN